MPTLNKTFDPSDIEQDLYDHWEQQGYFTPKETGEPFCIMIPPPNITGTLHMGHALETSMIDALVRYQRMQGKKTLWQMGTDHASIATQMVVERQLNQEGQSRHDLGRDKFLEKVWQWRETSGRTIAKQLRTLGASVDWQRERFTMDEQMNKAVTEVFVKLYEESLIYHGECLVNWDPVFQTAVSDLEVINQEKNGELWYIRYPVTDSDDFVTIATTRPETLLGDMAVAVHPEDERTSHLVGKTLDLPLTDRKIPIIADEYVDPSFGTGCVKITPAHDFNDYEVGKRHDLPMLNILRPNATLNNNVPKAYQGLDRFVARQKIIDDLQALDLLEKTEPHALKIPVGDRSGAVIEPYLTRQWFVKVAPDAHAAEKVVKDKDVRFIPKHWENTFFSWMTDLHDWCISRQLWWGHRIPAWYDDQGNTYVASSLKEVYKKYKLDPSTQLRQDEDVLDTWFSSALWPFATLGWPQETKDYETFYPTQTLVTGFDIIFFWVARMIMMGLELTGRPPFKDVLIHGLICDEYGQKMSKSKGNIIDPLDIIYGIDLESLVKKRTADLMKPEQASSIEKQTRKRFPDGIAAHGTDALRFTLCSLASTQRHIHFDFQRLEGYRNFCNKIWNAARFVLMQVGDQKLHKHPTVSAPCHWILGELHQVTQTVHDAFAQYRFDLATAALYDFIWHSYCDWYLEFSKPLLQDGNENHRTSTLFTLVYVLEQSLRLLHPFMPYITETIWLKLAPLLAPSSPSLMVATYPNSKDLIPYDNELASQTAWLKQLITCIRTLRAEMNISPQQPLTIYLQNANSTSLERINNNHSLIASLAKVKSIGPLNGTAPIAATGIVEEMTVLLPLEGQVDISAEKQRIEKNIKKLSKELEQINQKLNNQQYLAKAPLDIREKEHAKAQEVGDALSKLQSQLRLFTQENTT